MFTGQLLILFTGQLLVLFTDQLLVIYTDQLLVYSSLYEMAANPGSGPSNLKSDDIAIVGLACRFPGGASDETGLWDLLSNRKCEGI